MPDEPLSFATPLAALIERCCRGDESAWQEFLERYNRRIARYVFNACRFVDPSEGARAERARELHQDVYVRLLANDCRVLRAWSGADEASLMKYLATIVHAVACDALRKQRSLKRSANVISLDEARGADNSTSVGETIASDPSLGPEAVFDGRYAIERFERALASVCTGTNGQRNRIIFRLHVVEGLTAREIAAISGLNITTANVETILRRVRERLKSALR